jgi:hypothetical protein
MFLFIVLNNHNQTKNHGLVKTRNETKKRHNQTKPNG